MIVYVLNDLVKYKYPDILYIYIYIYIIGNKNDKWAFKASDDLLQAASTYIDTNSKRSHILKDSDIDFRDAV